MNDPLCMYKALYIANSPKLNGTAGEMWFFMSQVLVGPL